MTPSDRAIWGNREWRVTLGVCLALAAVTWFVFAQTLRFDFVNYDDPKWVTQNPNIIGGLSGKGVKWAFTRLHAGPLASVSHMLNYEVFGPNPAGHHFTNVFLHTLAVLLLFLVLRQMTGDPSSPRDESVRLADRTGNVWRSAMVAALFAIHPLRVESVAWVTERKDVLSGVFFFLTLAGYIWYVRRLSAGRYLIIIVTFLLGLLSKGVLVTLPVVLLLLDYWPLNRGQRARHGGQAAVRGQPPASPSCRPTSRSRRGLSEPSALQSQRLRPGGRTDPRQRPEARPSPS
jgi:hypothetical protein